MLGANVPSTPPSFHPPYLHQANLAGALILIAVAVCGACAVRAFGQGQQPDNAQTSVRGTVLNAVTHEAIGRALVYSPDQRFATLTDGEGHFEFTLPRAKTETEDAFVFRSQGLEGAPRPASSTMIVGLPPALAARKPGFLDDANREPMVPVSPGKDLTISLMPEAVIKGRVSLSTADPATNLEVQIFSRQVQEGSPHWVQKASTRTNSAGEFRFAELGAGTYKLLTQELPDTDPSTTVPGGQVYGYPPVYFPSAEDFAAAGLIQLAAGQAAQADLSLVRQPYYRVRAPVTNVDVDPGLRVTVSLQGHRGPGFALGYNAEEQRIEGFLPQGNFLVEAATTGPMSATGAVNVAVAAAAVDGPTMVLTPNGSARINVTEEFTSTVNWSNSSQWNDGKRTFAIHGPRAYLNISAVALDDFGVQGNAFLRPPTGPNDDSLVLENLAPGRYGLRVNSSRGYVAAATSGGVDLLHEPFVVAAGSSTPIEITMRDDWAEIDGTLSGINTGMAGSAAPNTGGSWESSSFVYCVPLPDSSGQFQQIPVRPDGTFSSPRVAPGTYRVLAFKRRQESLPYRDSDAMRAYDTKGPMVHLMGAQKENLQLQVISDGE